MSKETFIIRTEWYEPISELDAKDQATIFRNLFLYHLGDINDIVLDTKDVRLVWKFIEPTLNRNIESYDKRRDTSAANGQKGGRGNKSEKTEAEKQNKPIVNLNNLNNNLGLDHKPIESLSDSVYVSDSVSDSESVSEKKSHTHTQETKYPADMALSKPGTDTAEAIFYEQEICMRHSISQESLLNIYDAWKGDRTSAIFTKKEARQNFAGYCAKWKENDRKRSSNINSFNTSNPIITYAASG